MAGDDKLPQRTPHSTGDLWFTAGHRDIRLVVLCGEKQDIEHFLTISNISVVLTASSDNTYRFVGGLAGHNSWDSIGSPSACLWKTLWCSHWSQSHTSSQLNWSPAEPTAFLSKQHTNVIHYDFKCITWHSLYKCIKWQIKEWERNHVCLQTPTLFSFWTELVFFLELKL